MQILVYTDLPLFLELPGLCESLQVKKSLLCYEVNHNHIESY